MTFDLSDYIDVRQRIAMFREKYPTGSLQPADPLNPFKIVQVGDKTFVAYTACAFRTPDDPKPGIGSAWEPIPGRTPYTKDSELMNAETSAWGRAIVAVLAVDRDAPIASAEEVRNREEPNRDAKVVPMPAQRPAPRVAPPKPQATSTVATSGPSATPKQQAFIRSLATRLELGDAEINKMFSLNIEEITVAQAKHIIDNLLAIQKGEASMVFGDDGSITIVTDGARA